MAYHNLAVFYSFLVTHRIHLQNWCHFKFDKRWRFKIDMVKLAVMGYKREKSRMTPGVLAQATRRIKLPFSKIGKTVEGIV